MRNILFAVTLIVVTFAVAGCLGTTAQSSDLEEMKRRLAVVEQATVSSSSDQSLDRRMEAQAGRLADLQAELDALHVELQRVTGMNEEAAHQREQLHELLSMMRSELELKNSHFEERLAALTVAPLAVVPITKEKSTAEAKEQYTAALKLIQKEKRQDYVGGYVLFVILGIEDEIE